MRNPNTLYSLALFVFATPVAAFAQATGPDGPRAAAPDIAGAQAATTVQPVIVTADRSLTPKDQVGQQVAVLTLPQIRLDQETSLADILARTPGVSLSRVGGVGQPTSIFIRGAESSQTVVLIDGVKVNDPSAVGAGYDFGNLVTGDVSRIEVLRGPQSTLYGSEAIGGVVNVVTAAPTKPLEGDAQAEGGSYGTAYVRGGIGGKQDRYDWRIGAYYNSSDSVSAFDRRFGGKETDAFHTAGVSGRLRYDLAPNLQLDQRGYYSWSRIEFDGFDTPPTFSTFGDDLEFGRIQQAVDYTGLNLSLLDGRFKSRFAYQHNELSRRNEDPKNPFGGKLTYNGLGQADTFEYEGTYALTPAYDLVFGAQHERSAFTTASFGGPTTKADVSIDSGYGQLTGRPLAGVTLTGGVRYDAHSTFGDHATGQASAAWVVRPGTILRASFGQGFKAPSLYQLYSAYGNVGLKPETANGWDAGVEQRLLDNRLTVSAAYFGRETRNLIQFVSCFTSAGQCALQPYGYYQNVAKAHAEGVELQGDLQLTPALSLNANYTFDAAEDRSPGSATFGKQLLRRPKSVANLSATYLWPFRLSTTLAARYAGRSLDTDANTGGLVTLKAYTLVDIRASYPLRDNLELYARVENLTDRAYETAYQYGTLGRAGYAGVRVSF